MSQAKTVSIISAVVVALSFGSALAQTIPSADGGRAGVWRPLTQADRDNARNPINIPPARFDYFNPLAKIVFVPIEKVTETCRAYGSKLTYKLVGCAVRVSGRGPTCYIIVGNNNPQISINHEMAHCNGWPASHPR